MRNNNNCFVVGLIKCAKQFEDTLAGLEIEAAGRLIAEYYRRVCGQRTGYGAAIRGNDGRFTWHPWAADGTLDKRWPIVERKG